MHKKMFRPLDPGTWGGYKASHRLVEILNEPENNIYRGKVSKCFQGFTELMTSLQPLRGYRGYIHFTEKTFLEKKRFIFSENFQVPYNVKTHLFNIIQAYYNEEISEKRVRYKLLVQLNNKALTINKTFRDRDKGGIIANIDGETKFIPFTDTQYFEKVLK